jgi:hypothetical protein
MRINEEMRTMKGNEKMRGNEGGRWEKNYGTGRKVTSKREKNTLEVCLR